MESRSPSTISVTFLAERTRFGAPGFNGGADGEVGDVRINGKTVDNREQYYLEKGDTVLLSTPGGGGFGDGAVRDPDARAHDEAMGNVVSR